MPLNDVVKQIVYCENGVSVTDVMIDGRWVLQRGELVTIDEKAVYQKARQLRQEMDQRVQEQFRRTAELEPALRASYLSAAETAWSEREAE